MKYEIKNFWIGLGSVFAIFGGYFKTPTAKNDQQALKNDWQMVGNDFKKVLQKNPLF